MADPTVPPFDPNADMMFFAGMNEQQTFTMSPANVTNEFIEQSKLNIAAARSAPSSEARSVPAPDTEEPVFVPIRPAVTATSATGTSAKKRKRMTVTNADELPGANGKAAMATSPEPAATIVPWGLPPTLKRKRQPGKKQMNARVIPRSLAECDEADKELITLRDAGSEWKVIRGRWLELTGEKTATSTLPNRYARLKSNFTVINEEDNGRLIIAKRQVEESFEAQKWDLIAHVVQEQGGENYAAVVLKRQYKKLMVGAGAVPPPGVHDRDFDIELPESDGE